LRADARRNHTAVVAAAMQVLAADPDATMREIADASGLTRTTVYRHFPSRDELLRAIFLQVEAEADELTREATAGDPAFAVVMRAVAHGSIALGQRYRFLAGHDAMADAVHAETAPALADDPMIRYLARAARRGEIRGDLPPSWQARMLRSLAITAIEEVLSGNVSPEDGELLLTTSLIGAFAPLQPEAAVDAAPGPAPAPARQQPPRR
jgi:AcrR family transcriptional regulator